VCVGACVSDPASVCGLTIGCKMLATHSWLEVPVHDKMIKKKKFYSCLINYWKAVRTRLNY